MSTMKIGERHDWVNDSNEWARHSLTSRNVWFSAISPLPTARTARSCSKRYLQGLYSTWVSWLYTGSDMHVGAFVLGATLALGIGHAVCQEYSVKAVDVDTGKALSGMPITLRYDCSYTGTGKGIKAHCKFIQRKTGSDGVAHFPEAGSLGKIDDIFSLPITYGAVCCDIQPGKFPGIGKITFKRRTISEMMHWIFVGD